MDSPAGGDVTVSANGLEARKDVDLRFHHTILPKNEHAFHYVTPC